MTRFITLGATVTLLAAVAFGQTQPPEKGAQRTRKMSTLRILNQRIPDLRFVDTPFDQVMEWLTDFTQMNIVVRWQILEDNGIERDATINIQARNLRLSQVLWLIMNEAGGTDLKLAYRASGSLLVLSTEEDLSQEMITKVYDVSDLLVRPPRATRRSGFDVTQGLGEGQSGGGGAGGMFGEGSRNQEQGEEYGQRGGAGTDGTGEMETLVNLIEETVEPDSWVKNGGLGTIHPFRKMLIVRNTILVHQRLGGYVTEEEVMGP